MDNQKAHFKVYMPYKIMMVIFTGFVITAFALEPWQDVLDGFIRILSSRSVLVTDYIAVGGISATLINISLVGTVIMLMLIFSRIRPNGAIIMGLWLTVGFAFFGKNILNMIPLIIGVRLYAWYCKEPFSNYALSSMLIATISPSVSEIRLLGTFPTPIQNCIGILFGICIGFIFPSISAATVRVHNGYNLYNIGFAGGLVATILVSILRSMGAELTTADIWSSGNNTILAVILYVLSLFLFCCGCFLGDKKKNLINYPKILKHSGRLVDDFYYLYGDSVYINMGILCALSTTLVLLLGADLTGPAIGGIFTIIGFGSFGKHIKNVVPLFIGAMISAYINNLDMYSPRNIITILFATGIAPIAGQFGFKWGIVAGFLHVNVALHISYLNSGMNLYNNGFAAGFVALFLLPIITIFRKDKLE